MDKADMDRLTGGTDVKAEKVRILFDAGVERSEIARYLDIRYQHVHNVLKRGNRLGTSQPAIPTPSGEVHTLVVGPGGTITLPPAFVRARGIADGDVLICREEEGDLRIMSRDAAIDILREIARRRIPEEAALLEALLGGSPPDR